MIEILILIIVNNIFMLLTILATFFMLSKDKVKSPIQIVQEVKEKKKAIQEETKAREIMAQNIENMENYNGTAEGQKKIK